MFNNHEIQAIQMCVLEKLKAADDSLVELISKAGIVRAGGLVSFKDFVDLVRQPVKDMQLLYQVVGGSYEVDQAKVVAQIEQAWKKPASLHS